MRLYKKTPSDTPLIDPSSLQTDTRDLLGKNCKKIRAILSGANDSKDISLYGFETRYGFETPPIRERESDMWHDPKYDGGLYPPGDMCAMLTTPFLSVSQIQHPNIPEQTLRVGYVNCLTHIHGSATDRIHQQILEAVKSGDYDIVIAPEYTYHYPDSLLTREHMDRYVSEIQSVTNANTLVIPGTFLWYDGEHSLRNTAHIISGGEVVCSYDKKTKAGSTSRDGEPRVAHMYDRAGFSGLTYVQGEKSGVFEWNHMRIGIEICNDAGQLAREGIFGLDMGFLISCGNRLVGSTMQALRDGGYGFLVDGGGASRVGYHQKEKGMRLGFIHDRLKRPIRVTDPSLLTEEEAGPYAGKKLIPKGLPNYGREY